MFHRKVCLIVIVLVLVGAISIPEPTFLSAESSARESEVLGIDISEKSVRLGESTTIFVSVQFPGTTALNVELNVFDPDGIIKDFSEETIPASPNTQLLAKKILIGQSWRVGDYRAVATLSSSSRLIDRKEETFHVTSMGKKHGEVAAIVHEDFISDDLEFLNYDYDIYNEANIRDLFIEKNIYQYKSVLIGSYATDNPIIRRTLMEGREKVEEYVDDGGGVVVLAQNDYVGWLHKDLALPVVGIDYMFKDSWLHGDAEFGNQIDWYSAESDLAYSPNDLDEYKGKETKVSRLYSRCFYTGGVGWPTSTDDSDVEIFTCNKYRIIAMDEWFWDKDLSIWMAKNYGKGKITLTTIPFDSLCGSVGKSFYNNRWALDNMLEWAEKDLYRVDVKIFPEEVNINPDETVRVAIIVMNTGNDECDIDVVIKTGMTEGRVRAGWVDWVTESLEDVLPGEVNILYLEIEPPEGEDPGEYLFDVEAIPTEDPSESEEVTGRVEVNPLMELEITIGTGETKYDANELVGIRGSIENTGNIDLIDVSGKIEIIGPDNVHVEDLAIFTDIELDAGEKVSFMTLNSYKLVTWDTEDNPVGRYTAAVYFFEDANLLASKSAEFGIEEDIEAEVKPIFTDASSYEEDERVVVTDGEFKNIGNTVIEGTLVIKIQEFGKDGWKDKKTIVDTYHKLRPGEKVDLKEIWEKGGGWKAKGKEDKSYRVYAAILGPDKKPIEYGDWLEEEEIETFSLFRIREENAESWFEDIFDWIFGGDDNDDDNNFFEDFFDIFDSDDDDDNNNNFFEDFFDWIFGDSDDESSAETTQIDSNVVGEPTIEENGAEEDKTTQDGNDEIEMYWEIIDEYEI